MAPAVGSGTRKAPAPTSNAARSASWSSSAGAPTTPTHGGASPPERTAPASMPTRSRSRNRCGTTTPTGAARPSRSVTSWAPYRVFTPRPAAPSAARAKSHTGYSSRLGSHKATTSPRPTPRLASSAASAPAAPRSPSKVSERPLPLSTSAARGPCSAATASSSPVNVDPPTRSVWQPPALDVSPSHLSADRQLREERRTA